MNLRTPCCNDGGGRRPTTSNRRLCRGDGCLCWWRRERLGRKLLLRRRLREERVERHLLGRSGRTRFLSSTSVDHNVLTGLS